MHSVRLSSRFRNEALFPLLDDDIAAVEAEEHRRETRKDINRLVREVNAELRHEAQGREEEPSAGHEQPSNVVRLHGHPAQTYVENFGAEAA